MQGAYPTYRAGGIRCALDLYSMGAYSICHILHWRSNLKLGIMKLGITSFLLMAGLLFSAPDKASQDKARCLDACNKKCAASLASCKKAAKNDTDIKKCQQIYDNCGSICVNKACQ
jgi:hypothetical protein